MRIFELIQTLKKRIGKSDDWEDIFSELFKALEPLHAQFNQDGKFKECYNEFIGLHKRRVDLEAKNRKEILYLSEYQVESNKIIFHFLASLDQLGNWALLYLVGQNGVALVNVEGEGPFSPPTPAKNRPQLVSSIEGRISELLITIPGHHHKYSDIPYYSIVNTFSRLGRKVIIYSNRLNKEKRITAETRFNLQDPRVEALLSRKRGEELHASIDMKRMLKDGIDMMATKAPLTGTGWAQDLFCVLKIDDQDLVLLQPVYSRQKKFGDKLISMQLASVRENHMYMRPTTLILEGGNILRIDDYALIGLNTLAQNVIELLGKNSETAPEDLTQLEERIAAELGVNEVIWVGHNGCKQSLTQPGEFTYQPFFHIDLFLTPAGKVFRGDTTVELLLVGDVAMANDLIEGKLGHRVHSGLPISKMDWPDLYLDEMMSFFTLYNQENTGKRSAFELVRLPLLFEKGQDAKSVLYSYNNAVVEEFDGKKHIFLPNYVKWEKDYDQEKEINERDDLQNKKFKLLQLEVERILHETAQFTAIYWVGHGSHFRDFAYAEGALNCLTKVLRRTVL